MIQSVNISGLRGIKSGVLSDFAPLTVLVGPNGSGKSTVLEALLIGASPKPSEAVGRAVRRHPAVIEGSRWLFTQSDEDAGCEITVTFPTNRYRTCKIHRDRSQDEPIKYFCDVSDQDGSKWRLWTVFEPPNRYTADPRFLRIEEVPDVRIVESPGFGFQPPLYDLYTQTVEQGRRRTAREILRTVVPGLDDIEILTEGNSPVLHFVFPQFSVPAALCGDGIHALLRLVLELSARQNGLVLLEEPEVHQHPKVIRQSAAIIVEAVQRGIQVVLTTHSLDLIDALINSSPSEADLSRLAVYRVVLNKGELAYSRFAGADVAFARRDIEDDLR